MHSIVLNSKASKARHAKVNVRRLRLAQRPRAGNIAARRMHQAIANLVNWYQSTLDSFGYLGIAAFMAMESTVLPIPSELVIPFAAQRAHANGHLSLAGIVVACTVGSWIGATLMYWASRWAGRPFVLRYGRYFLVPEAKV